jgi:ABC-type multidrug transport system fused ATPase/permease subunit
MERRTWHTITLMLGTVFLFVGLINYLFWALAILFFTIAIMINSDINKEELMNFLSSPVENNVTQMEEEKIKENKPKEVSSVEAEIIGFEKQVIQMQVEDKETKALKIVNQPIAVITLRSDIPDMLPVGKIVELAVKKEK